MIKKFTDSKKGGTFGSIYFLNNFNFELDHISMDNNRNLKEDLVVKKQTRDTKFGTSKSGDLCFAFNELTEFQTEKSRKWKELET